MYAYIIAFLGKYINHIELAHRLYRWASNKLFIFNYNITIFYEGELNRFVVLVFFFAIILN